MNATSLDYFNKQLRSALNHLYDPDYLRSSPLVDWLGVPGRLNTPLALQNLLTQAIESMQPAPDTPANSQAWITYDILLYRYVQQLGQEQVASQLGISVRQLARHQATAIEVLAYKLWDQFKVGEKIALSEASNQKPQSAPDSPVDDLSWLSETSVEKPTNLVEELQTVLALVKPLITHHSIRLETHVQSGQIEVTMHPVALRQALLSLINVAIHHAERGWISIKIQEDQSQIQILIQSNGYIAKDTNTAGDADSLEITKKLVSLSGGSLTILQTGTFQADLRLPFFQRIPILAIDDNQDILNLLERFVTGTRYHLIGTRYPEQAIDLAQKYSPRIIILDVMMPAMDGWQMLGRLRQHPLTSKVPILVCTIIAQEELAYALGAGGYIRKPIMRETLLSALDRLISPGD